MPPRRLRLSKADVERLLADSGTAARIETMGRLVSDMEAGSLTEAEGRLARHVLTAFAADAEAEVRAAVAWQIHNSSVLTADLAERLARDVASVAFPILRHAELLPDELLLEIVAERDPQKQLAIAGRRQVSSRVSAALVETGNLVTVVHLLRNRGAHVAEAALGRAIERFGQLRTVADSVAARPELTVSLVERLIAFVTANIRQMLVARYRLEPKLAERLAARGREAATLRLLQPLLLRAEDAEMVARHLNESGRLTPQLLFRALCAGDHALFEAGIAARAGITPEAARLLAWDVGPLGLRCLFDAADLPWVLARPFRVAIQAAAASGYPDACDRADYQTYILDRLFSECGDAAEREVDDLLMQVCDQPGLDAEALLLPVRR
ncbi:DUF2336 domain-containing protein [Indioceanicola profundi]|uniref:DUF2336 domain-containing protein n=1 Tax=Indioceanicola profundi TaxID=2220096 RepID=UPI001CEC71A8|nr:DUF2336 domain-containing protein [Indioceanicola profundi]